MEGFHKSVLADQAIEYLRCAPGGVFCDGTVGLGGHAEKILEAISPLGKLIGIDLDSSALALAKERLARFGDRAILLEGNYKDLPSIMQSFRFPPLDGVFLDLGVSSYQLQDEQRGFSFLLEGPLFMNFDIHGGRSASQIINQYTESRLMEIFWEYGQERWARRIARRIAQERAKAPIDTTARLVQVVCSAIPGPKKRSRIHPATRTFQALRIEVNQELENLEQLLKDVWGCLKHGARVCIISFHSLEDRLVKRCFRDLASGKGTTAGHGVIDLITKRPIMPAPEEIRDNPRSRSARLRVAEWH